MTRLAYWRRRHQPDLRFNAPKAICIEFPDLMRARRDLRITATYIAKEQSELFDPFLASGTDGVDLRAQTIKVERNVSRR